MGLDLELLNEEFIKAGMNPKDMGLFKSVNQYTNLFEILEQYEWSVLLNLYRTEGKLFTKKTPPRFDNVLLMYAHKSIVTPNYDALIFIYMNRVITTQPERIIVFDVIRDGKFNYKDVVTFMCDDVRIDMPQRVTWNMLMCTACRTLRDVMTMAPLNIKSDCVERLASICYDTVYYNDQEYQAVLPFDKSHNVQRLVRQVNDDSDIDPKTEYSVFADKDMFRKYEYLFGLNDTDENSTYNQNNTVKEKDPFYQGLFGIFGDSISSDFKTEEKRTADGKKSSALSSLASLLDRR